MSLCAALFNEFSQFLQIMLWIIVPIVVISVATTIIVHYRKKKRIKSLTEEEIQLDVKNSAESFCYKTLDGKLIYLDHTGLLKELRKKLSCSNAKFAALQHDFKKLKLMLTENGTSLNTELNINKKNSMENLENSNNHLLYDSIEKETLADQLTELKRSYTSLEAENISLLEQIGMRATNGIGSDTIANRLKDENKILRAQLADQEYHKDILEEKKSQIEFLQSQIDLRIKKYHESEQERIANKAELELIKSSLLAVTADAESSKNEIKQKQADVDTLLLNMNEKENELNETLQSVKDKQTQIIYIENVLQELRQQNEMLNAAAADTEERNKLLLEQFQTEEAKSKMLEQKLIINRQLIQRLHNEFSNCIKEENDESPVISLRPGYARATNEWEETAVH